MSTSSISNASVYENYNFKGFNPDLSRYYEKRAIRVFERLNTVDDGELNEKDDINKSMLDSLRKLFGNKLTLNLFKNQAQMLCRHFTYTTDTKYNGTKARITYSFDGEIKSVDVGAKTPEEAAQKMGLERDGNQYYRIYKNESDGSTVRDSFSWNSDDKTMKFDYRFISFPAN